MNESILINVDSIHAAISDNKQITFQYFQWTPTKERELRHDGQHYVIKEHKGEVPTRGSGNYASEEAKEIARLQRELRDTKDALEVLKKAIGILEN